VALPPRAAVTVEGGTRVQTSELPLGDGAAVEVAVGFADRPADGPAGDGDGDEEEQAVRTVRTATTAAATAPLAAPPLDKSRNRIDTVVADSRRAGSPCQGG
jgi:hypothetical protein